MYLEQVDVTNFRNLQDAVVAFDNGINWLVGENGQGKTNCLEATYFGLTGKSFRTSKIRELIRDPDQVTEIRGRLRRAQSSFQTGLKIENGKSQRFLGGKPVRTLDFLKTGSVIAFTSRSKMLVEGSPDDRRRFIDRMVCYANPDFLNTLGRYRQILGQLKGILHKKRDLKLYQSFKSAGLPLARKLVEERMGFLNQIEQRSLELFHDIFQGEGELFFKYQLKNCPHPEKLEQKMMDLSAQELLTGRSLVGPHLDDLEIRFKDNRARNYASSGQVRGIVLSLKLAVRELIFRDRAVTPLLLLDDIDAELDNDRLQRLLEYLEGRGQTLITTSKYGIIRGRNGTVFHVHAGRISSERKT